MNLSQSHCYFRSHMKSSFHSLIPFLPLFCSCQFQRLDSIQFLCSQAHIPGGWCLKARPFTSDCCSLLCHIFWLCPSITLGMDLPENTARIVDEACLPRHCLTIDGLLSCAYACAGMCLPSRCLAMGIHVMISWPSGESDPSHPASSPSVYQLSSA
jgi:hypothetical protein